MKREDVKARIPGITDEQLNWLMNENGSDINAEKGNAARIQGELDTANATIKTLRDAAKSFEGVDVAELQRQLNDEKAGRRKDRQTWNLRSILTGAGCTDVDYLLYKLGNTVEYEEDGSVKNQDAFLESCRKDYAAQFPAQQVADTGVQVNTGGEHGTGGSAGADGVTAAFARLNPGLKID